MCDICKQIINTPLVSKDWLKEAIAQEELTHPEMNEQTLNEYIDKVKQEKEYQEKKKKYLALLYGGMVNAEEAKTIVVGGGGGGGVSQGYTIGKGGGGGISVEYPDYAAEGFKSAFEAAGGVGMPGGEMAETIKGMSSPFSKLDSKTRSILIQRLSNFLYQVLQIDLHYVHDQMAYVLVQRLTLECPLCEGSGTTFTQHVNQHGEELDKEETTCIVCHGAKTVTGYQQIKIMDQELDRILGMIYG